MRRIDVIELVDDRIELGHPRLEARIRRLLLRPRDRLIAKARQTERNHVVDRRAAELDVRGLRDEPLRPPRHLTRAPILPEVIARLARRQADRVAGGIRPLRVRTAEAREHEHARHVDVSERGDPDNDVRHEPSEVIGVVDHPLRGHVRDGPRSARGDLTLGRGYSGRHTRCQDSEPNSIRRCARTNFTPASIVQTTAAEARFQAIYRAEPARPVMAERRVP